MKIYLIKHCWLFFALIMGCALLPLAACSVNIFAATRQEPVFTGTLIQEKCVQCHGLERITQYRLIGWRWEVIVDRMSNKKEAGISKKDSEQITTLIKNNYTIENKELFNNLCVGCHQYLKNEELLQAKKTPDGWSRAIERMRRKYSFLIGKEEAELLKSFWGNEQNNPNIKKADKRTQLLAVLESKCLRCHTHAFVFGAEKSKAAWKALLKRKHEKYKYWLNKQDIQMIETYLLDDSRFLFDGSSKKQ